MVQTDPIADLLTRIRNAQNARHSSVDVPSSKMKIKLAELLSKEGYIAKVHVLPGKPSQTLRMDLKYHVNGEPLINEIKRISKPGCRIYATAKELAEKRDVVSTMIVTTSRGIMTDQQACEAHLGGEILCRVM